MSKMDEIAKILHHPDLSKVSGNSRVDDGIITVDDADRRRTRGDCVLRRYFDLPPKFRNMLYKNGAAGGLPRFLVGFVSSHFRNFFLSIRNPLFLPALKTHGKSLPFLLELEVRQ